MDDAPDGHHSQQTSHPPVGVRLVWLVNVRGFGGVEQHSLNLAAEAQRQGASVLVVAPPGAPILARLAEQRIPARALSLGANAGRWRGWLGTLLLLNPLAWLWFGLRLRQMARETPSVFLCPFPREQVLATWWGVWWRIPIVWIVHAPFIYLPHRAFIWPLWRRLASKALALVVVSQRLAHDLTATGLPPDRLAVIPNAVSPVPNTYDSSDAHDPSLIVVVSRLTREKGVQYLVAAMPRILERVPSASLAIAGTGKYESALREQVRRLKLGAAVRFLGFVEHPAQLLHLAGVSVCPSAEASETLPTTILEAYAWGVPVVATCVGGIPDVVENRRTGLLVPPADSDALASAIVPLLLDPQRARLMGASGQALARQDYSVEGSCRRFLSLVAACVAAAPGASPSADAVVAPGASPSVDAMSTTASSPVPGKRAVLIHGTALLAIGKVVTALATAWWTILAARALGATAYGNLMLCAGLVELGAIVADAGVTAVGTREAARVEGEQLRRLIGTLIYLKFGLGVVATALLLVVALYVPFDQGVRPLLFVLAPSLVFVSLNTLTLVFRARLALGQVLGIALFVAAAGGVSTLLAYLFVPTATAFAQMRLLTMVVAGVVTLWLLVRRYRPRFTFDARLAGGLLVSSLALGVALALNIAYYRIDVPLLALLTDPGQVAIYTSAYRVLDVVTLLPASAAAAALPLMAAMPQRERLSTFAQEYLELAVACGLFAALFLTLSGPYLLTLLYAGRYSAAWPVLQVLVWAGAATFVTNVFSPLAVALNQRMALVASTAAGLLANVGLNLLLIPRLNAVGPAYATLATEVIVTAPLMWTTMRHLRWRLRPRRLLIIGLATAATPLLWTSLRASGGPWWWLVLGTCAIWAAVVGWLAWHDVTLQRASRRPSPAFPAAPWPPERDNQRTNDMARPTVRSRGAS